VNNHLIVFKNYALLLWLYYHQMRFVDVLTTVPKKNRFGTLLLDLLAALSVKNTREYLHSLRFSP